MHLDHFHFAFNQRLTSNRQDSNGKDTINSKRVCSLKKAKVEATSRKKSTVYTAYPYDQVPF